jgi:hypothetical protein
MSKNIIIWCVRQVENLNVKVSDGAVLVAV